MRPHHQRPRSGRWGIIPAGRNTAAGEVTHGGITTDLLRNLPDNHVLPLQLLTAGIPPYAVTAIDDLAVVTIASIAHL